TVGKGREDDPSASSSTDDVPSMGEKEKDSRKLFLRDTAVLLEENEIEYELGFSYARNQFFDVSKQRSVDVNLSMRFSLGEWEGFVSLPYSYVQLKDITNGNRQQASIDDLNFGIKKSLFKENVDWPDIIGSLSLTAPTGKEASLSDPSEVATGGGQWLLHGGLTFIRSYDPAVLYGTIGAVYAFDEDIQDIQDIGVTGGNPFNMDYQLNYGFGMGFAINQQITFSQQFNGAFIKARHYEGIALGDSREPMSLTLALTIRRDSDSYFLPWLSLGLNDDASDVVLGLSYSNKF
ncbi:MAG: hypothetical protein V3T17_07170, partial [Pseudomonadales bacterium]